MLKIQSSPQIFENQRDHMQLSTCHLRNVLSAKCSGRSVFDFLEKGASEGRAEVDRVWQVMVTSETHRKAWAEFWEELQWRRIRPRFCRALNTSGLWSPRVLRGPGHAVSSQGMAATILDF